MQANRNDGKKKRIKKVSVSTLIGFDFLDESKEGNHEAKLAYEKGKTIITNPFELIQGGVGMGVDYSLSYIDDAGNANYLYGNTDLGKDAVKTRFAIRNLTWEIAVKPQKGWFAMWKVAIALICANEETLNEILNKVSSILDSWQGDLIDKVSVSIGYASHRQFPDLPIRELAKIADQKMYEAKRAYYQRHDRRKMR